MEFPLFGEDLTCDGLLNLNTNASCFFEGKLVTIINAFPLQNDMNLIQFILKNVRQFKIFEN